jgi:hypothetical protein
MGIFNRKTKFESDQLSSPSVAQFVADIEKNKGIVLVMEPGYRIRSGEEQIAMRTVTEFVQDPKLGLLCGIGKGHAYVRAEAVKALDQEQRKKIRFFYDLVNAVRAEGYRLKQVAYLHIDPC